VIIPARLFVVMIQLHGVAGCDDGIYKGFNPGRVMVPPPSVHVRAIPERHHGSIFVAAAVHHIIGIVSGV